MDDYVLSWCGHVVDQSDSIYVYTLISGKKDEIPSMDHDQIGVGGTSRLNPMAVIKKYSKFRMIQH